MSQLSIVLLQLDIIFGNPEANRQKVSEWFAKAKLQPNELVLLPELWDTGYDLTRLPEIADQEGKTAQGFLSELAKKYQVFISGGSIARQTGEKVFNTTYIVAPTGEIRTQYDKVHLFRLMEEEKFLHAGKQLAQTTIADFLVAPLFVTTCVFQNGFVKVRTKGQNYCFFLRSGQRHGLSIGKN